jgi:hypothetical protein
MAGDDQIPPIFRLCIISLLVSLCQLACLIRFGDGLAPSEPRRMMSDRTIAFPRQAPSVADFSFVKFPENFNASALFNFE